MQLPDNLADHPRYGCRPRVTGLDRKEGESLGWKYHPDTVVPGPGIVADIAKQNGSAIPIYVYYDVLKWCVDCGRPFLFFAVEQRYWFETLGFAVDADCVRCSDCRKSRQGEEATHREYQRLLMKDERDWRDWLDLANASLDLFALGRIKRLDRIRECINAIPEREHHRKRYSALVDRLKQAEQPDSGAPSCSGKSNDS